MKEVKNQNVSNLDLGSQESMNVHIWRIVGSQQRKRQNWKNPIKDSFFRKPVASVHCIIRTENYLDVRILLNYDEYEYNQGYEHVKEAFRSLARDDILQPYLSSHDFRSSKVRVDHIGKKFSHFSYKISGNFYSRPTN